MANQKYTWVKQIEREYAELPEQQRKVAVFMLENPESIPMITASSVAKLTETSEATVSRICQSIGYTGWVELQRHAQQESLSLRALNKLLKSESEPSKDIQSLLDWEIQLIDCLRKTLSQDLLDQASRLLINAQHIYSGAARSSLPMAQYLGHYLNLLLGHASVINTGAQWLDDVRFIRKEDAVVLFCFTRFTKGTLDAGTYLVQKQIPRILVTDSEVIAARIPSDHTFLIPIDTPYAIDSKVAVLSFIHALVARVSVLAKERVIKSLQEFEELAAEVSIFSPKI